jgi:predicted RNase H-related nuclease YkuK (DUF458 family)
MRTRLEIWQKLDRINKLGETVHDYFELNATGERVNEFPYVLNSCEEEFYFGVDSRKFRHLTKIIFCCRKDRYK